MEDLRSPDQEIFAVPLKNFKKTGDFIPDLLDPGVGNKADLLG